MSDSTRDCIGRDNPARGTGKLGNAVRCREGAQFNDLGCLLGERGGIWGGGHQGLDRRGRDKVGEGQISKHLGPVLHALECGDRLFGSVDVAQANRVQLEDRGEEGCQNNDGDERLREGGAAVFGI